MEPTPTRRTILAGLPASAMGAAAALAVGTTPAQADGPHGLPTVDVTDFGAVGDGTTEDTSAFQAAVDHLAETGGGTLHVPAKTYVLASEAAGTCVLLRADNLTVHVEGATFRRPDRHATAIFVVNTRRDREPGHGAGIRNLTWHGGTFLGDISSRNIICPFALHHAQHCTFSDIRFENCQGMSSHIFDMVGADDITIRDCDFLGQETKEDDTENVAEAVQIGASYKGGLTGGSENYGFSGVMTRDITIRDCRFLPFKGEAGPTPFGFHGGVEGKFHQGLAFLHNTVVDPRTSCVPDDKPQDTNNRGTIHLSDAHDVSISGNTFRQTTQRTNRAITIMGFAWGVLDGTDPDFPERGNFTTPQTPEDVTISNNSFIGFPAETGYDTILVGGFDGTSTTGVDIHHNTFRDGHNNTDATASAIYAQNMNSPTIAHNSIRGYYVGVDLSKGRTTRAQVTHTRVTNTTQADFPAAVLVDEGLVDSVIERTRVTGYEQPVAGTPGNGTVIRN